MKLSYRWFVNETDVGERSKDINFTVTKNHQYNQYSCEALEKNLVSKRSDPIQINPLCKILYVLYNYRIIFNDVPIWFVYYENE